MGPVGFRPEIEAVELWTLRPKIGGSLPTRRDDERLALQACSTSFGATNRTVTAAQGRRGRWSVIAKSLSGGMALLLWQQRLLAGTAERCEDVSGNAG